MLTITQLPNKQLSIKCDYYYRFRIKQIPTAHFNPDRKEWIIESFMLGKLEEEFKGELVYKTPRWVILEQPMPDMSKMYQINNTSIQVPSINATLYDYQQFGVKFMIDKILQHNFVILADDVGLGKTLSSICVFKWFIENKGMNKILIICKKTIKTQWISEINKFTELNKDFWIGYTKQTPKQREKAYNEFKNSTKGILVTNYHNFLNDTDKIKQCQIDFVVIDEVHEIKARTGVMNNNIASVVQGKPVAFLTGTPVMSRPEDIFGIVQIQNPMYFGAWKGFSNTFLVTEMGKYGIRNVGAKNLDKLRQMVQDIVIRRTEYEVAIQLPKTVIQTIHCDMDSTQKKIIKAINEESEGLEQTILEKQPLADKGDQKAIETIERLTGASKAMIAARQAVATDPRMFVMSKSSIMTKKFAPLVPASYKMSSKVESIIDIVQDIISNGDKVILFSKFRTSAVLVANDIQKNLKENVLLYTGSENDDTRDNAVTLFRNTSTYNIICGTEALSTGLNLQCAGFVINIDQPDTHALKTQRIGRARRVGSAYDHVTVYDMITTDETGAIRSKDEERLENINKNMDLNDALVNIDEAQRQALINTMKGA